MRFLLQNIIIILSAFTFASAETPCYFIFYGNPDGTTIDVYPGSDVRLNFWAATPAIGSGCDDLNGDDVVDSMVFMYTPLASNDSFIVSRDGGQVFYPLDPSCDSFMEPELYTPPGYTTQALASGGGPGCVPFSTDGDTLHIADFFMRTSADTSLIGRAVCPLIEGYSPANGGLLWGIQDGVTPVIPAQSFSCLYFVDYLAGDANGSGNVDAVDVTYLVNYCKGFNALPDPIFAGDANGDCVTNAMDVVYLVAYFKGGPAPLLGDCH